MATSYVVDGTTLKCSLGGTCTLKVPPGRKTFIQGKPQANVDDYSTKSIPKFSFCSIPKSKRCTPSLHGPWKNGKNDVIIEGAPALMHKSKLMCSKGGVISILKHNQCLESDGALVMPVKSQTLDEKEKTSETPPSKAIIPYNAWELTIPAITSKIGERNPSIYDQVIDQFEVETQGRYKPYKDANKNTYCNIFAWDVTRAMGAEIPQRVDVKTNEPRHFPDTSGTKELNANGMIEWLRNHGAKYGWKKVTGRIVQEKANEGKPAVAVWYNPKGIGHFQVVRPTKGNDTYTVDKGPYVAQAGSKNYNYGPAINAYNRNNPKRKLSELAIEFYYHE